MKLKFVAPILLISVGVLALILAVSADAKKGMSGELVAVESSDKISKEEQTGEYEFDKAHSSINFKIKHMGLVDVPGHFREFEGKVNFDASKVKNSTVEFSAQTKSVDTGINARDNHLRSKDFFEVMAYPEMKFVSTKVKKKGKGYRVTGDLTLKGVTRQVEISMRSSGPILDERGSVRMGFTGSTSINRRDFNVTYGGNLPNGTPVLSDWVVVDLQIEAFKKKQEEAKE